MWSERLDEQVCARTLDSRRIKDGILTIGGEVKELRIIFDELAMVTTDFGIIP